MRNASSDRLNTFCCITRLEISEILSSNLNWPSIKNVANIMLVDLKKKVWDDFVTLKDHRLTFSFSLLKVNYLFIESNLSSMFWKISFQYLKKTHTVVPSKKKTNFWFTLYAADFDNEYNKRNWSLFNAAKNGISIKFKIWVPSKSRVYV